MAESTDINLKTFNTAKKFAEEILFPKMDLFQKYQRQADFGTQNLEDAVNLTQDVREIERFNGLKAMNDILNNLLINISSTVLIKNNKLEIKELNKLKELVIKLKVLFYEHKERFFINEFREGRIIEVINREYFEDIKEIINTCYINAEMLMTKNKLLFSDAKEDYVEDAEIRDQIKKEYVDG